MASIKEIEERRAKRKEAHEAERAAQYALDLEALDALEVEHGDGRVSSLTPESFVPGLPTFAVVRVPSALEMKRFRDKVRRDPKSTGEGLDELAAVCIVYPDRETYERMRVAFPGMHDSIANRAVKLAEAKTEAEKKA